jgi:hypothetical protein
MSKSAAVFAVIALSLCLAIVACSTAKGPAEAAIKAADEALGAVKSEASIYTPEQLKGVEDSLAAAKDSFQKGEYPQALTGAQDLASKAKDLSAAVTAKKDELAKNWQDMSGGLPGMLKAIQSRVDILSKSKKLPAGLDAGKFESAKTSLASITQAMTNASESFKGGNLMEAVNNAKMVKEKATEIMNALGMKPPQAAAK